MGKSGGFYAVALGRQTGIYTTWSDAEAQVKGFAGARYKKFATETEARSFMVAHSDGHSHVSTSTSVAVSPREPTTQLLVGGVKRPRIDSAGSHHDAGSPTTKRHQRDSTTVYYVVAEGHTSGVFTKWPDVMQQIEGYDRPVFRKFASRDAADAFLAGYANGRKHSMDATKTDNAAPASASASASGSPAPNRRESSSSSTTSSPSAGADSHTHTRGGKFWYAVAKGRKTGVFESWAEAKPHVDGLFSARFKKFATREDAEAFVKQHLENTAGQATDPDPRRPDTLVAFCDGSALQNGRYGCQAGFACIFPHNPSWNVAKKLVEARATNNRAEYLAALEAMKRANTEDPTGAEPLYIFSDSMLLIRSMTEWVESWRRKNWMKADGSPVMNRDLLELLLKEKGSRRIIWRHVKAHTGRSDWQSKWNDVADNAARNAAAGWEPTQLVTTA
ncbi:hypothetical protein P43SY_003483 [Pythium insidiosum]|uniref:ribonuclease H n=1 Tax=Pythium insidiosum TaxID=114742 RepID=A0AAD5QCM8_PYTIN|nr:hypothetical protein P43SY_003483 [Pythium insidiosum]